MKIHSLAFTVFALAFIFLLSQPDAHAYQEDPRTKFCQLHYELEEAKAAQDAAFEAIKNCGDDEETCVNAHNYYWELEGVIEEIEARYDDHYYNTDWGYDVYGMDARPYYYPHEEDEFWQWCLGLPGPPGEDTGTVTETPDPQNNIIMTPTPTATPQVATPISLKAALEGGGTATQSVPNPNNAGSITIQGAVVNQDGVGVAGATVEVVGGANATSTTTNPDGTYAFTVSVDGGMGSDAAAGIDFTLQVGDLTIDRIVILQAIEGGQLVSGRAVGVRVFLNWGLDQPANVEVTIKVDGNALLPVRGVVKKIYTQLDRNRGLDAINLVIPKDRFPSWGSSTHTLETSVALVGNMTDSDPNNNTAPLQNFTLTQTANLSILYVSLDQSIGKRQLVHFAARAHSFLNKVYPVSYSWGFVGTSRVSHYLVSPYVGFMKSADPDDLPFNLGDIGIVEGGLEVGKSFSYKSAIIAIEKARKLYNTQRCKDASGELILPCPDEVAIHAVGVYPKGAFGASKDGFAFADRRNEWHAAANSVSSPDNVAHELGHLFGFGEEYSAGNFGVPVTGSSWDGVRFRTENGTCVNIMGNIGLACPWINAPTWNSLLTNSLRFGMDTPQKVASLSGNAPFLRAVPAEIVGAALLVEGVITSEGQGFLTQVSPLDRYLAPENPGGPFKVEAWDANGNSLGGTVFDGLFFDLDVNPVSASPFLVVLPVLDPAAVAEITVSMNDNPPIDTLIRSPTAPQVAFDAIPAVIDAETTLTWQATDADGDAVVSTLYYGVNGGTSWQVLGMDLPATSFTLDPAELPGGTAVFKVVASDGFNTAEAVSTPATLPDQPPVVTVITPWGAEFDGDEIIAVEATAYDLEDGPLPPETIQWSDANGNPLGTGGLLQTTALVFGEGTSEITVQVQDSTGQPAQSRIAITVTGTSPPEDPPLTGLVTPSLVWIAGGACGLALLGGLVLGGVVLLTRRRRRGQRVGERRARRAGGAQGQVQDAQGNWWYQDPDTGQWYSWNGQGWQAVAAPPNNFVRPRRAPAPPKSRRGWLPFFLSLLVGGVVGLLVVGGISLVAFNFFPAYQITLGTGDWNQVLKMGGGGLLVAILGFFLLNGGLKAVITRRAVVEDEWGRRREKRGCGAILTGLGQLFFGLALLAGGLGLVALAFYQEVWVLLGL